MRSGVMYFCLFHCFNPFFSLEVQNTHLCICDAKV